MTMLVRFFLAAALATSAAAASQAPGVSLVPMPRPGTVSATTAAVAAALMAEPARGTVLVAVSPLPIPRPRAAHARIVGTASPVVSARAAMAGPRVAVSLRPIMRPARSRTRVDPPATAVTRAAVRSQPAPAPTAAARQGAVCGDKAIRGTRVSAIPAKLKGCGVARPVRVTMIDGVALSSPATINCDTAKALKKWVNRSVKPRVGRLGGGVHSLKVAASYSCRTRNNIPGAKISEHGRGNAIDISAIVLKNGVTLTVLKGWRDKVQSKILKAVHREACGTFGTVLGPNADSYHKDHFHLDVARHRGGAYCR